MLREYQGRLSVLGENFEAYSALPENKLTVSDAALFDSAE
jgi:hypothetical protein